MVIYVVQPGDTLESIAREYGVALSRLITENGLDESGNITVGQTIVILYPDELYTVRSGDTLSGIADYYGVSVNSLLRNNPILKGKSDIYEGQTLVISYSGEKMGNLAVNGYIYPFVEREVLERTLPYLTYLTLFTYGFMPSGELIDKGITEFGLDEDEIISLSREAGVAPVMHLSTLTDAGVFSSELAKGLLRNEEAQNVLINNVIARMREKNYYGFDVDFEYLNAEDKDLYVAFLTKMQNALTQNGYIMITALAPKSSDDQMGMLYESHDYRAIGNASDYVLLMTYEWGYMFGPPMAVAPINQVERVVSYGVSRILPEKIFMGIPNYAYDWTLPYEAGRSKAVALSNVEAVNRAIEVGADIMFDEIAQTPFYNYTRDGKEHIVWFEDARSIDAKLKLIQRYGLYGASYWNVMKWFPQNWLVLNSSFNIDRVLDTQ